MNSSERDSIVQSILVFEEKESEAYQDMIDKFKESNENNGVQEGVKND